MKVKKLSECIMKKALFLLLTIGILACCACGEENLPMEDSPKETTQEPVRSAYQNSNFDETYWTWHLGPTNGSVYSALFHSNGTFSYIRATDFLYKEGTYSVKEGVLCIDDLDYSWTDDGFYANQEIEIYSGGTTWTCSLIPDPEKKYDTLINSSEFQAAQAGNAAYDKHINSRLFQFLTNGCWYQFGTQSSDCLEYIFQDNENVWIRYRDFMTGNGEYCSNLDETCAFQVDEAAKTVTVFQGENTTVWNIDVGHDVLWLTSYDGPSDTYVTVQLKHYLTVPDASQVQKDQQEFLHGVN